MQSLFLHLCKNSKREKINLKSQELIIELYQNENLSSINNAVESVNG